MMDRIRKKIQDLWLVAIEHERGVLGHKRGMGILALGALLEEGTCTEPIKDFKQIQKSYAKSGLPEFLRERVDIAWKGRGDQEGLEKRYRTAVRRKKKEVEQNPFVASQLLVRSLPRSTFKDVFDPEAPVPTSSEIDEQMQRFVDKWLGGSSTGMTALSYMVCLLDFEEPVRLADTAISENPTILAIITPGKGKEQTTRQGRAIVRGARKLLKGLGYKNRKVLSLVNHARMWARVQVVYKGSLDQALKSEEFLQRFGKIKKSNLSTALAPFDASFGIVRRRGPPMPDEDISGPPNPSGTPRIAPTRIHDWYEHRSD